MVLLLFFVDFESDGVVVIEEDAEEVVKVDLLVPLGDLEDVVGHDQVRHLLCYLCLQHTCPSDIFFLPHNGNY